MKTVGFSFLIHDGNDGKGINLFPVIDFVASNQGRFYTETGLACQLPGRYARERNE